MILDLVLTWEKRRTRCPFAFSFGSKILRNASFPLDCTNSLCCRSSVRVRSSISGAERYGCWHIFLNYHARHSAITLSKRLTVDGLDPPP